MGRTDKGAWRRPEVSCPVGGRRTGTELGQGDPGCPLQWSKEAGASTGTLSLHSPVFQATELRLKSQWLRSPAWVLLGTVLPAPPVLPHSKVPLENHRLQALSMTSFLENRINSSFPARTCAPPSPKSSLHLSDPELMTLSI